MRFLLPLVLFFTALGLGIYAYLGGLHTPTTALETSAAPVLLAGQPFHGPANAAGFGDLFRDAKRWQQTQPVPPPLANLYYDEPKTEHDSIRAFVGVRVADTTAALPTGWHYRALPAGRRAAVARLANTSFLLAPGKLYAAAEALIAAQKLTKQPPYYEQFGADDVSEVWVGVK